eukprot:GHVQ01025659.1.p1 GENE.GHVQ01025659.1~~GHVQ01025659.1.p1  ORF type:complete len:105 (+),score=2.17 GHVQ01025659.1:181-495(+)
MLDLRMRLAMSENVSVVILRYRQVSQVCLVISDHYSIIFQGLSILRERIQPPCVPPGIPFEKWISIVSAWLANGASHVRTLPGAEATKFATYANSVVILALFVG